MADLLQLKEHLALLTGKAKSAERGDILGALRAIDTWLSTQSAGIDPQLLHFLERRSYLKAWHYLDSQDVTRRN